MLESGLRRIALGTVLVLAPLLAHCGLPALEQGAAEQDQTSTPEPRATGGSSADAGPAITAGDAGHATTPSEASDAGAPTEPPTEPSPSQPGTASFACGQPYGAHTTQGGHDVYDVRGRAYRYFVPAHYDANRTYPVVVAIHGVDSPGGGLSFSDWFGFQDHVEDAAIVVYPSAAGNWNVGNPWDDFAYLDEVLGNLGGKLCFDSTRVYGLGYSLGGYFAQRWACQRADVLRGVAITAAGWPGEEEPAACAKVPTLVYGRVLDYEEGIDASRYAREQNRASLQCGDWASPPWMLAPDQGVVGCNGYVACGTGKPLVYCEDPSDLGDPSWNHTFAQSYHQPVWRWLGSL